MPSKTSPEDELEALMAAATLPPGTRRKLGPTDAELARLEAAGYKITDNVWRETVVRAPGGVFYQTVPAALRELDLLGDDGPAAVDAVRRLQGDLAARDLREELLRRVEEERRAARPKPRKGKKRG